MTKNERCCFCYSFKEKINDPKIILTCCCKANLTYHKSCLNYWLTTSQNVTCINCTKVLHTKNVIDNPLLRLIYIIMVLSFICLVFATFIYIFYPIKFLLNIDDKLIPDIFIKFHGIEEANHYFVVGLTLERIVYSIGVQVKNLFFWPNTIIHIFTKDNPLSFISEDYIPVIRNIMNLTNNLNKSNWVADRSFSLVVIGLFSNIFLLTYFLYRYFIKIQIVSPSIDNEEEEI
jgi:hypothetical protein